MEIDLFNYYGLDWLSMLFGFWGMWLLGKRHKAGFIFTGLGMISALVVALLASQYGFMVANLIMIILSARNYILWSMEERSRPL